MSGSGRRWLIISSVAVIIVGSLVAAYSLKTPAHTPEVKRYPITGLILGVRPEDKRVTVANDNIAGFMQPMVMDYAVKNSATLSGLKRGDDIRATLASDGASQWILEDITVTDKR